MTSRLWRIVPVLVIAACGSTTNGTGEANPPNPQGGDASVEASTGPTCTSNAACIDAAGGASALCASGRCVTVDKTLCIPAVLPNVEALRQENVVVVGGFVPSQSSSPLTHPNALAYALALKELEQAGGIPGNPRRNVAMILCASEPELIARSVDHVVRDLRVPAMIGNFPNYAMDPTLDFAKLASKENVFTVNPTRVSPAVKFTDVKELVWNLLGTTEDVALAYRPLLQRTEAYVRSRPNPPAGPIKVAVVSQGSGGPIESVLRYGQTVAASGPADRSKALVFNGKDAAGNGANFAQYVIPAGKDPSIVANGLATFGPDVIIALGFEHLSNLASALESMLGASARLPVWLLSPTSAGEIVPYLATASQGGFSAKQPRFLGVSYAGPSDASQRTAWLARMAAAYPKVSPATFAGADAAYDSVYWLAYGLAAAGPGALLNGASFGTGVRKMLAGPKVHPGSADAASAAFRSLSLGGATFGGTLGPPDIDSPHGTWNGVGGVYCYGGDAANITIRYDVLRWNRNTGALDGTLDCFVGF